MLDNPWFADDKSIHKARKEASKSPDRSKFQAYTMTTTSTSQIDKEIETVKNNIAKEKKE